MSSNLLNRAPTGGNIVVPGEQPKRRLDAQMLIEFLSRCGDVFFSAGQLAQARTAYTLAVETNGRMAVNAQDRLGRIALREGRYYDAADHFKQVMRAMPENYGTLVNMSIVRCREGRFEDAMNFAERAIREGRSKQCLTVEPFYIIAAACSEACECEAEQMVLAAALEEFPRSGDLLDARAAWNLLHGNWEQGWADYEHRRKKAEIVAAVDEWPEWDGSPLGGQSLMVFSEQGIGDVIMFARYLSIVRERNPEARITLFTRPELALLLRETYNIRAYDQLITSNREFSDSKFNSWIALGSLPRVLKIGPPLACQLMKAPRIERIEKLVPRDMKLRVGLVWRGNPEHERDKYRSIEFETLKPVLDVPGCSFYSLQFGGEVKDARVFDLASHCFDASEIATAASQMDMVITVDTGVGHIAGALGVPVWLLCYKPWDWRWGKEGESTPWYPGHRLFRAENPGEWAPVIESMVKELALGVGLVGGIGALQQQDDTDNHEAQNEHSAIVTQNCRFGEMKFFSDDKWVGRSLANYGEWSQREVDIFRRLIKPGDTVVEAGANVGAHTLALAGLVGSEGVVLAFEPNPAAFALLEQNVAPVPCAIKLFRSALGPREARADLVFAAHNPGGTELKKSDNGPVLVEALDAMPLARLDLLKIDAEGMELAILVGAEDTITTHRPLIYVEDDRAEQSVALHTWLINHGYRIYRHLIPLYSQKNWRGEMANVFGDTISIMLLAVPAERYDLGEITDSLERLRA